MSRAKGPSKLAHALKVAGATLKRQKKHLVYELPNGQPFATSQTPSDSHAEQNALSDLGKAAGVPVVARRPKAPAEVRAERRRRPGREESPGFAPAVGQSALANALSASGVVEHQLRARIAELEAVERQLIAALAQRDAYIAAIGRMWVVRVVLAIRRVAQW